MKTNLQKEERRKQKIERGKDGNQTLKERKIKPTIERGKDENQPPKR